MARRGLGIDAGAITRMLDRLEAKGLVERVRSETDRRVVHVRLTEAGETRHGATSRMCWRRSTTTSCMASANANGGSCAS
jgi:DNA-binding HxlR family transcriptional regulator